MYVCTALYVLVDTYIGRDTGEWGLRQRLRSLRHRGRHAAQRSAAAARASRRGAGTRGDARGYDDLWGRA